jgi:hypothetical protein
LGALVGSVRIARRRDAISTTLEDRLDLVARGWIQAHQVVPMRAEDGGVELDQILSPAGQAADPHRDLLRITGEQPIYLAGRQLGFRLAAPEPATPPVMRSFFRHVSRALQRGAQS